MTTIIKVFNKPNSLDRIIRHYQICTVEKNIMNSNLQVRRIELKAVLRIRIRIRMNPHDFGLLDPHPESAFQMRIPDADADQGKIAPMIKKI
jgi:hypothetical protein